MKNCLVTKLNGVVDNDNLEVLDHFKITFAPGEFHLRITNNAAWVIDCDNVTDQIIWGSSTVAVFPINSTAVVEHYFHGTLTKETTFDFCSKYAITRMDVAAVGITKMYNTNGCPITSFNFHPNVSDAKINISEFKGREMTIMRISPATAISGSLNLSDIVTSALSELSLASIGVSGDISVLGICSGITSITLNNSSVTGNLERLLETLHANGRQSTDLVLRFINTTNISSNIPAATIYPIKVIFSASGCEVRTVTTNFLLATYDGTSWTYENV